LPRTTWNTQSPHRPLFNRGSRHAPEGEQNGQRGQRRPRSTLRLLTAFGGLESFGVSVFINSLRDSRRPMLAVLARCGAAESPLGLDRLPSVFSLLQPWLRCKGLLVQTRASADVVGRQGLCAEWPVLFRAASRSSTASRA
jgi:hypothetical protein